SSDIYGYIDNGWNVLNSAWSPLYIVGSSIARTQQQVHDDWNTFRTGTDGFTGSGFSYGAIDWDEFDTPAAQNLTTGGMLCTWEVPTSIHLDRVRLRLPAMAEHAWNHQAWPYAAGDFADFRARFLATDAILPAFLGTGPAVPDAPSNLTATNGDIANAIEVSWRGSAGFPDGYRVLRNTADDFAGAAQIAEVDVDEFFVDTSVTVNTPYYYWVKAFNETGESPVVGSVLGSAGDGIARTEAHESFSYASGQSIDGMNGGDGWSGAWSIVSANGTIQTVASSLSYSTLPASGGALRISPSTETPAVDITRDLAEDMGTGGTSLWLSFLFRGDPRANGHAFIRFDGAPGIGKNWGAQFAFENTTSGINMNSGETYFVVVRFDFGATDDMYMWINPSLASEPATGAADLSVSANVDLSDQFLINIQGYGQGDYQIDEIRLGPSWNFAIGDGGGTDPNDMDPPTPDPMTWISPPVPQGASSAAMAATPANDPWGVEYYFEETSGNPGGDDSDWQDSPNYTDSGLQPGNTYTYRVKARDKSPQQNETGWSFSSSVDLSTPGEATPSEPDDGGTNAPLDSILEWTGGSGASSHDVYFGTSSPLLAGDFQGNQSDTTFDPGPLSPNTTYYWRIDEVNAFGTTTGPTWSFTTGSAPAPGSLLLHEEFDNYQAGSIIGQTGQGTGLSGAWEYAGSAGTFEIGQGLSGANGLIVNADGTGDLDARITHSVPGWGTGVFYMSYLWNETSFQGHAYVSAGGDFAGAFGHAWNTAWAIDNVGNGVGYNPNTTYRLVAKIDFGNGETTMWADPASEADTPVAFKTAVQQSNSTLILRYYGTDGTIDDIRIGTDFNSVIADLTAVSLELVSFTGNGSTGTITFKGTPGVSTWKVMGSADLATFDIDETSNAVITEISPGVYTAVLDFTGYPAAYFLRIEE
ncbi:MAG: fibronectin type III domain-containing protein, partial [Verrucomicrobiota bacterium]